ncbi:hypothetical protein [Neobacillus sp.]|uniref:hypothetical protein n=1 Tax=Neobacillus sp. TaxID=2675273 RepID=UPI00289E7684|nr:hypothetical protein [Neobacillus sp.]
MSKKNKLRFKWLPYIMSVALFMQFFTPIVDYFGIINKVSAASAAVVYRGQV